MAFSRIWSIGTPFVAAFDEAADLVECAENLAVSIPASNRLSFIHRPIVVDDTGLCGFLRPMNSLPLLALFLNESVK